MAISFWESGILLVLLSYSSIRQVKCAAEADRYHHGLSGNYFASVLQERTSVLLWSNVTKNQNLRSATGRLDDGGIFHCHLPSTSTMPWLAEKCV
jgi:hypothetical protein